VHIHGFIRIDSTSKSSNIIACLNSNPWFYCRWNISQPYLFLNLSGSIAAVIVMTSVYSRDKDLFSLVGVSICAAYTHNLSSLAWVYFFFIQQDFFFRLLPIFFTFSLLTGLINGVTSNYSVTMLREEQIRFK
jgi:heptaprenyl diphosphate synthase